MVNYRHSLLLQSSVIVISQHVLSTTYKLGLDFSNMRTFILMLLQYGMMNVYIQ